MSRIHELLSEMKIFLDGVDLSNSSKFRALADEYNTICRGVIEDLEECQKKIQAGLIREALKINQKATPPFTERVRILMFKERSVWLDLCRLYQVTIPPEFNLELVETLESEHSFKTAESMEEVLAKWRKIARTGSIDEKLLIVRKLVALDKTSAAWRQNLEQIEKTWIREKLIEADAAFNKKDGKALFEIFNQLMSPEILHPIVPSEFSSYMNLIQDYQKSVINEKIKTQLNLISDAYLSMDYLELQDEIQKWDALATDPRFEVTDEEKMQVEDARQWLTAKLSEISKKNRFKDLHNKLEFQLNQHDNFLDIAKTYYELEQLDLEINSILQDRFAGIKEQYFIDKQRNHSRKIIFGLIITVVAVSSVIATILYLQHSHEVKKICANMSVLIQNDNPEGVLEYIQNLTQEKSKFATNNDIIAKKNEAEQLINKKQQDLKYFAAKLEKMESYLTLQSIESPQAEKLWNELNQFEGHKSREQANTLLLIENKREELFQENQNQRDASFNKKIDEFANRLTKFENELNNLDSANLRKIISELTVVKSDFDSFLSSIVKVNELLQKNRTHVIKTQIAKVDKSIEQAKEYYNVVDKLNYPKSTDDYIFALSETPTKAPSKFLAFQEAIKQIERVNTLKSIYISEFLLSSPEAKKVLSNSSDYKINPYCQDLSFLMTNIDALNQIKLAVERLKNTNLLNWKMYELILKNGEDNYFFYYKDKSALELERAGGRLGGAFKSLVINKIQLDDTNQQELILTINKNKAGDYTFSVLEGEKLYCKDLPESFDTLVSPTFKELTKDEHLLAQHYIWLESLCNNLSKATSLNQIEHLLLAALKKLPAETTMNPLAKNELLNAILALYGDISEINYASVSQLKLSKNLSSTQNNWLEPAGVSKFKNEIKNIENVLTEETFENVLSSLDLTKKLYQGAIERKPVPVGVFYLNQDKIRIYFFQPVQPEEFLIYQDNPRDGVALWVVPHDMLKKNDLKVADLPVEFQNIYNGQIIYMPENQIAHAKSFDAIYRAAKQKKINLLDTPKSIPRGVNQK